MHEVWARCDRLLAKLGSVMELKFPQVNWGFIEDFPLSKKNDTSAGNERGIDFVIKFVAKEEPYRATLKR
jgi:hypothetical protein